MIPAINYIFIISVLMISSGIINAIRLHFSIKYLGDQLEAIESKKSCPIEDWPYIIVLIPALRESKIIGETIERFTNLHYPKTKLKVVIITTEREFEHMLNNKENTINAAEEKIRELNAKTMDRIIYHIHYPGEYGTKSDQLNYAINKLRGLFSDYFNSKTYIGVYDADSITLENTLEIFAKDAIINGYPDIYQQPTFYFNNYKALPLSFNGLLSKSFSWLQSAFAIYHEAHIFITQFRSNKELTRMEYCIGHGLFVRWLFLEHIGLFPTPIEDTRLGHIASYMGKKIKILPLFDGADVTIGIKSQIKQFSTWFIGEAFIIEDLKITKKIMPNLSIRQIWLAIYKAYRNIVWIIRSFLFLFVIMILIIAHSYLLAVLTFFSYLYLPPLILYLDMPLLQKLVPKKQPELRCKTIQTIGIISLMPIEFIIMSLGPILGLFNFLSYSLLNKKLILSKTER